MPTVYPETQTIETGVNGTTYVKNLKIMLASDLYDKYGEKIKLKKTASQPPVGWWASEKWDGIRAIWDGEKFVSRGSGRSFPKVFSYVPEKFTKCLPSNIALDGEIWISRNNFGKVSAISNLIPGGKYSKDEIDKIWEPVIYKIFDIPSMTDKPFSDRHKTIVELISKIKKKYPSAQIEFTEQIKIESDEHLASVYRELTSKGAEGIILKDPTSFYEPKRSKFMLKYKIHNDAEGIVIGHQEGTGRLKGTLGSLEIEVLDNKGNSTGIITFVGTGFTDIERTLDKNNKYFIPKGTVINFRYMELTKDAVRHPVYRGIRGDM